MYEKGRLCEGVLTHTHQQIKKQVCVLFEEEVFLLPQPLHCPVCLLSYVSMYLSKSKSISVAKCHF